MIVAYLRERFRLGLFAAASAVIAAAASGGGPVDSGTFMLRVTWALVLLAQFRIWDDLADRARDAVAHPGRVLARSASAAPVVWLGVGLLAINAGLALLQSATSLSLLALLHLTLAVHYLLRRRRTLFSDQVLLAKYPAFVCVLAGQRLIEAPLAVGAAAALVYAAASAYEAWHDPVSPLGLLLGGRT